MKAFENISGNRLLKIILTALAATVVIVWLYPHQRDNKLFYEEGRPWNYAQLIAPFDIPIHPDSATLRHMRDTLDATFVPIYTLDISVVDSLTDALPPSSHRGALSRLIHREYEKGVVSMEDHRTLSGDERRRIRVLDKNVMSEQSSAGVISVSDLYSNITREIGDNRELRDYFVKANISGRLQPSLRYDEAENKRHYDNEYLTLTADRGVILQGQAIINKGDIITPQDYTNLHTYEQLLAARATNDPHSGLLMILGQAVYVILLMAALLTYCAIFDPKVFDDYRALLFLLTLIVLFFMISSWVSYFVPGGVYLVPMAMVPVLVLVFFSGSLALMTSYIAVLVVAPIATFSLEYIYLQFCAATAAVFTLRELSRRSQLLRTASVVALAYIAACLALELLLNGNFNGFTWRMPVFLLVNSLLTSMAYILMVAVERTFGFVSTVTLVELADTNQPLLRKLSDTCPGTFQHSMSVSNLAADAARAMGANEQLVRAGALYHDIGKMANPAFFTENQHGVNPHDSLPPQQSARVVISHVTEGLRMADKAGLPAVIKDFISEHHGKGITKYFYYTYCNANPDQPKPDTAPFTYPGPNPHTRETSLLMMADAVEAASRSLKEYTTESIKELVDKIIDGQIAEGLHADSTLEFRDIPLIKRAFVKRLSTMYHTRVKYPDAPADSGNK